MNDDVTSKNSWDQSVNYIKKLKKEIWDLKQQASENESNYIRDIYYA